MKGNLNMTALYIILGLVILVILYIIAIYNGLVRKRQQVKEAWSTINTQLKRRYDLIPNLIETVKGYVTHEKGTLEAVVEARAKAMQTTSTGDAKSANENMLSSTLKSLFALSENYPDLKANTNFLELQREFSDTETKIQATRQFYNTVVMALNAKIEMFPSNIVAKKFGFKEESYFELEAAEKEAVMKAPKVQF